MSRYMKKAGSRIRRYEAYRSMPWRNGRGFTLEIAREPAAGEEFAWRLSLADIDRGGEFSAYPGYRRALALVAGKRLNLKFRGHGNCSLGPARRGARFEGGWQTRCAIPQGRCTDLSLIVHRGSAAGTTSVVSVPTTIRLESAGRVVLARGLYGALYVIEGSVEIAESIRSRPRALHARDTLLFSPGPQRTLRLRSLGQSAVQLVFLRWRPGRP